MKCYMVDAFTDAIFKGNTAAVCILDKWLPDDLMQDIARENNQPATTFTVKNGEQFELRWFTRSEEINLCGHGTLATAYVLMRFIVPGLDNILLQTQSGLLKITKREDLYEMDLPAYELKQVPVTEEMEQAIGFRPLEAWMGRDLVCVMADEEQVRQANPDQEKVKNLNGLILHITAKGNEYDCITRSFAPKLGTPEDPVCGSGHCHVIPLWSEKLNKQSLLAYQASQRSGVLYCRMAADRVFMAGKAVLYSSAEVFLPDR